MVRFVPSSTLRRLSLTFPSLAALGLLGEIQLGKHDDYAQWGIEILVSFRDKEPLQVLTSHRQSGGVSPVPRRLPSSNTR
jgi:hypothetical protein